MRTSIEPVEALSPLPAYHGIAYLYRLCGWFRRETEPKSQEVASPSVAILKQDWNKNSKEDVTPASREAPPVKGVGLIWAKGPELRFPDRLVLAMQILTRVDVASPIYPGVPGTVHHYIF